MSSRDNSSVQCLKWVRMTSHRSREIEWRGSNVRHPRSSIADRSHLIVNRSLAPVPSRRCIPCVSSKWFSTLFLNQCHRSHYRYTAKTLTPLTPLSLSFPSIFSTRVPGRTIDGRLSLLIAANDLPIKTIN